MINKKKKYLKPKDARKKITVILPLLLTEW